MAKHNTAFLQNWLSTVVMSAGPLDNKIGYANHLYGVEETEIVANEGEASVQQRLNVYSSGYMMRLLECMYADYAISKKFMGDEVFDSFAKAYLAYHPSTSFTLYDLGRFFPDFLEKTKPKLQENSSADWFDIPVDLARVERARQQAMRLPGMEELNNTGLDMHGMLFGSAAVTVPDCLQLLELDFPIKHFYNAVYRDGSYDLPQRQRTFVAISRNNYRIVLDEITEAQYRLLQQCRITGDLYKAISAVSQSVQTDESQLLADAILWLPYFQKCGFVVVAN